MRVLLLSLLLSGCAETLNFKHTKAVPMTKDWINPCVFVAQTNTITCMTMNEMAELQGEPRDP